MKAADDIAAGDLNCSIALYGPTYNQDGDEITGDALIAAGVAAAKRSLSGAEALRSGRETSEQIVVWTIRYRAGIDAIKSLTHAGSRYDIQAVDDPTGNRRKLEITTRLVK